jgi:hypothetical protein
MISGVGAGMPRRLHHLTEASAHVVYLSSPSRFHRPKKAGQYRSACAGRGLNRGSHSTSKKHRIYWLSEGRFREGYSVHPAVTSPSPSWTAPTLPWSRFPPWGSTCCHLLPHHPHSRPPVRLHHPHSRRHPAPHPCRRPLAAHRHARARAAASRSAVAAV